MAETLVLFPTFRIGAIAAAAGQLCLRHLPVLVLLNALPILPALLFWLLTGGVPDEASAAYLIALPVSVILTIFAQGATVLGTFHLLRGEPFGLRRALRAAWWTLPLLTGTGLLAGVIVMLGFAALFVPGLMAICVLFVTLPCCIIERTGLVESLERSAELTRGYRWPLFWLLALTTLPFFPLSALTDGLQVGGSPLIGVLGDEATTTLFSIFTAVLTTICFEHLRRIKGSFVMLH